MRMLTIYDHPSDYPNHYAIRECHCVNGDVKFLPDVFLFASLDQARVFAEAQGLVRMDRFPQDDPGIVEVWL